MKADSFCMRQQDSPVSENFSDATWLYINSQRSSCKRRKTDYEYLKCPVWGVTRRDRIRYKEVCDWVDLLQDVANRIQQRRMQYFGHVQRMDHTRYPKLALHGYVYGTRRQGRPKKRWMTWRRMTVSNMSWPWHSSSNRDDSTSFGMEEPGEAAYARNNSSQVSRAPGSGLKNQSQKILLHKNWSS